MKIQIKNGHVIDPKNNIASQLDVFIAAGKIVALGKAPEGFIASQTIDASNLIVCPGLVDLS
ncbi:MAG: dihydroorotase, partial [Pseudomonadota bacterium]